jgi:hypothetical protein
MYKLWICEIWTKISRQNHFSMRTLIFPSGQSLSESMHYYQRDIFRLKHQQNLTHGVRRSNHGTRSLYKNIRYNICGIWISSVASVPSRNLNDVMRIVGQVDVMSSYIGVTSSRRYGELGVWNSRIKSCFLVVFVVFGLETLGQRLSLVCFCSLRNHTCVVLLFFSYGHLPIFGCSNA